MSRLLAALSLLSGCATAKPHLREVEFADGKPSTFLICRLTFLHSETPDPKLVCNNLGTPP